METKFEKRLEEILRAYPDADPVKAALALKGQPEATDEQIAQLSKLTPAEQDQVALGKMDRPSKQTGTPPDLAKLLQEEYAKKYPHLPPLESHQPHRKDSLQKPSPKLKQMIREYLLMNETLSKAKEVQGWATMAEHAFLVLSHKWHADVQASDKNTALPRAVDMLALSCLLLAVEWGDKFTDMARHQMETNRETATANRNPPWYDSLLWELCQVPFMMAAPSETIEVGKLTGNLDHHNSSIRCWIMEIGWMARSWLATPEAIPLLLKNLADTLGGPFMAAGLAAALVSTADEFWILARDFKHHDEGRAIRSKTQVAGRSWHPGYTNVFLEA